MKHKTQFFILFALLLHPFLGLAAGPVKAEKVAESMGVVWGFDFLSKDEMLVTDRAGVLSHYQIPNKKRTILKGIPQVFAEGQGGLLDLRLHPDFAKNKLIYFTYAYAEKGKNTTRLARAKFDNLQITDIQVIFTANAWSENNIHFGSRIAFGENGYLYISIGERNERDKAQDLKVHNGKILRMKDDGSNLEIWSYGHRNPQGLFYDKKTEKLWVAEHGPRGGDEINLVEKGKNYGWPVVSYGREYWGPKISDKPTKEGITEPVYQFTPSIAACGLVIYSGTKKPEWKDSFLQGSLKLLHLNRLYHSGNKFQEERLFQDQYGRIRNVGESPDGYLYFSTDSGEIYRVL